MYELECHACGWRGGFEDVTLDDKGNPVCPECGNAKNLDN